MESEALLLGIWKNVAELEELISLDELEAILSASHDREHRQNKFLAALKGIDIDKDSPTEARAKFEEVKRRAHAKMAGQSQDSFDMNELGLDMEIEE